MHGQRLARQERHHQVQVPLGRLTHVRDGADVRMHEPRGDDRLAPQPLHGFRVALQLGQQHLDGDLAVALEVTREVDVRHPACPDPVLDAVAPGERQTGEARGGRIEWGEWGEWGCAHEIGRGMGK